MILVEQLIETEDSGARRAAVIALLQLEIEKALRLAERTMDGLVVVFARTGLRLAPEINADKPGALSARNNLPCFLGLRIPLARKRAHNSHTGRGGDQVL